VPTVYPWEVEVQEEDRRTPTFLAEIRVELQAGVVGEHHRTLTWAAGKALVAPSGGLVEENRHTPISPVAKPLVALSLHLVEEDSHTRIWVAPCVAVIFGVSLNGWIGLAEKVSHQRPGKTWRAASPLGANHTASHSLLAVCLVLP
jgi:hypothetical protein